MDSDEALDLVPEFLDAAEHPTVEGSAFQLSEPAFDGVEPRGTGGREMELEARMAFEPGADLSGLVSAAVVQDQVEVQVLGRRAVNLSQEIEELFGPVAPGQPAHDLAGENVKGGVQARGAMALVVVRAPLDLAGLEGQQGLRTVERLDLGLLVPAQDHRVVRRVEVEADDIDHLVGELRVLADLEGLEAMRFEVRRLPDLPDLPRRHPGGLGHEANTPVRGLMGDTLDREAKNLFDLSLGEFPGLPGARQVSQPVQAVGLESPPPLVDGANRSAGDLGNRIHGLPLGAQQHDPRPKGQSLGRLGRTQESFEGLPFRLGNLVDIMFSCHAA